MQNESNASPGLVGGASNQPSSQPLPQANNTTSPQASDITKQTPVNRAAPVSASGQPINVARPAQSPLVTPAAAGSSVAPSASAGRASSQTPASSTSTPSEDLAWFEADSAGGGSSPQGGESKFKRFIHSLSRKQWLMLGAGLLLVVGGVTSYFLTKSDGGNVSSIIAPKKPVPPPEPPRSPLTGVEVSEADSKHIVTGVMIENSTNARPQSGLDQAGVVFEAIAEYGITRFLALYQEQKPGNMGPIRSVRPYYIDWAKSFDAPIAHVGGSPDALNKIRVEGVKDLDQMFNSGAYRRIGTRPAPHNVYSTMPQLNQLAAGKGWTTSDFKGMQRRKAKEVKPAVTPTAKSIDIAISGPTYNVHYDYDSVKNEYKRVMAGAPHVDGETRNQLSPKVVIGLATSYGLEPDGYHSRYQITGTGKAKVFQSGTVTEVTWHRETGPSQYSFKDAAGKPFLLDPGQTWITVVGDIGAVKSAP